MARLIHIGADEVARAAPGFGPFPEGEPTVKARRPVSPPGAWFQLTPAAPWMDTRIAGVQEGVAAGLELFGTVGGIAAAGVGSDDVAVLGGNAVAPGAAAPAGVDMFSRQSTARLTVRGHIERRGRQALLLFAVHGHHGPIVQVFLGLRPVAEAAVADDDRIAVVVDAPSGSELRLDLHLRLAGTQPGVRLGVRAVQGVLL